MLRRCLSCGVLGERSPRCGPCSEARRGARQRRWRAAVLDRDGHRCVDCGEPCPHPRHHDADHRLPLAEGGAWTVANGVTRCAPCHRRKTERDRAAARGRP